MQVFTVMRPWEPLEVSDREAEDLRNMGLLMDVDSTEPPTLEQDQDTSTTRSGRSRSDKDK